jgi:CBS domain-containing protein
MNTQAPVMLADPVPESPPVAAAEARAVAPLLVSGIEAIARSRLLTVATDALLVEVAALLSGAQISVVVVCDAAGAALGIITETTLVRRLGLGQADFFTTQAGDVMTPELTACAPEDLLSDVLAMMHTRGGGLERNFERRCRKWQRGQETTRRPADAYLDFQSVTPNPPASARGCLVWLCS